MLKKSWPTTTTLAVCISVLTASTAEIASAQFVPGRIFTAGGSDAHCKVYRNDWVYEFNPEDGTYRIFASMPLDSCAGLESIVMSPDGKHLRVAARNWGAILEFDSQGNWEVVIDGSDGVFPAANWNSITYDREGNFYLSNYYTLNEKVVKFPANGGPKKVLAYANNNGVEVFSPYSLSVGPDGEVYVADGGQLVRIGEDGVATIFDTYDDLNAFIYSVLVDDYGYLHTRKSRGYWYRYVLGDPGSREIFEGCDDLNDNFCPYEGLFLSPDRSRIYTSVFDYMSSSSSLVSVDPRDGSYQTVMNNGVGASFAVVPLRGDVNGDHDTDLVDMQWIASCLDGSDEEAAPNCGLADMDADGDVDLFDVRYFMLGYTAFHH